MKFLTDGMLGKLTRWLRMLGHDVKYANNFNDEALIELSKKDKRILLTRDLQLYNRATKQHAAAFFVEGKNESKRLASLAERFNINLELDPNNSRCPKCNTKLKQAEKQQITDRIPHNTMIHYEEFWECPKCGKIYWQGAHWKKIIEKLAEIRELLRGF